MWPRFSNVYRSIGGQKVTVKVLSMVLFTVLNGILHKSRKNFTKLLMN